MSDEWLILDTNAEAINEHVLYSSEELTVLKPGSHGFKLYLHGNDLTWRRDTLAPVVTVLGTTYVTSSQVNGKWTVEEMQTTILRNKKLARKSHPRPLSTRVRYESERLRMCVFPRGVCFDESMYTVQPPENHCRVVIPFETVPIHWYT